MASGRVKVEEALMLVDSYLSLCRLGLELVTSPDSDGSVPISAAAGHFAGAAVNLLYVLLSSSGNNGRILDTSLNAAISGRLIKMLELASPSLTSVSGLWQCFLKLLATNGSLTDAERLALWPLLLRQILALSNDENDKGRWVQFAKILLKLLKHPLRRTRGLDDSALGMTVNFISRFLLPNDPFAAELLALPCVPVTVTGSGWRMEDLVPLRTFVSSSTIKAGTLGAVIRDALAPVDGTGQDLLSVILQGQYFSSQISKVSMKLATGWSSSSAPSSPFPVLPALYSAIGAPGQAPRRPEILFASLCAAIVSVHGGGRTAAILGILIEKLVNRHKFGLSPAAPLLQRIIFWAHAGREQMRRLDIKGTFEQVRLLASQLCDLSGDHLALCYWPLSCLANIVRQCPQPTLCSKLFNLAMDLVRRPTCPPLLLSLCGSSLLACLCYLELPQLSLLIAEALPRLPVHRAMRIFAILPLAPSLGPCHTEALATFLQRAWQTLPRSPLEAIEFLRHCEIHLKFATDVSLLERPELAGLQTAVIEFLQRKPLSSSVPSTWISDRDMLVAKLRQLLEDGRLDLSTLAEVSLPPLSGDDDGPIISELVGHLRDHLERLSGRGRQRALVRVREIMQSY